MRVITGTARGRKLLTPPGLATRPTAESVKEAVFSMIHFRVPGARVLDLFAGSGQMGVEALSRGASFCLFVDNAATSQQAIRENLAVTGLGQDAHVVGADLPAYLKSVTGPFHIAFLDPPYGKGLAEKVLPAVAALMAENGEILCETDVKETLPPQAGDYTLYREHRYGKTKITRYRHQADAGDE